MPVKLLLADKSITIQKVVEMLFSGKEYEVTCVSDGDSALGEANRIIPNVVLADVDLPRIDGYSFANRLKDIPTLARVPVILMLSRDDQYDADRGRQAGIVDSIAKPFESQELISKVKKALTSAAAPTTPPKPAALPTQPAAKPSPPTMQPTRPIREVTLPAAAVKPAEVPPTKPAPMQTIPSEIFAILDEAPEKTVPEIRPEAAPQQVVSAEPAEEEIFEVEPEIEVEPEKEEPVFPSAAPRSIRSPVPERQAVEWKPPAEEKELAAPEPATAPPDDFGAEQLFGAEPGTEAPTAEFARSTSMSIASAPEEHVAGDGVFDFGEPLSADTGGALPLGEKAVEEMREGLGLEETSPKEELFTPSKTPSEIVTFESLDMASRATLEDFAPPTVVRPAAPSKRERPPERPVEISSVTAPAPRGAPGAEYVTEGMLKAVATETVEKMAKELIERVAWEVIPDLAERMIRAEIERLKTGS